MGWNDHIDLDPTLFWAIEDKQVCVNCVYDPGLKLYLKTKCPPSTLTCSYCGNNLQSTTVGDLQTYILNFFSYVPVHEVSPRNDGEWLLPGKPSEDFIESLLMYKVCDGLFEDFWENAVDQNYCEYDWSSMPLDAQWRGRWEEYCQTITKGNSGFVVNVSIPDNERNHDEPHPNGLYIAINEALLQSKSISRIPAGTQINRVRWGHIDRVFSELTSPPGKFAQDNRFSPTGVSMFYGASDLLTACAEINASPSDKVTLGVFETIKELTVIDFTATQFPRGSFDPSWIDNYYIAEFLKGFCDDIRKDVKGMPHSNGYLPTQAICHHFHTNGMLEEIPEYIYDPEQGSGFQSSCTPKVLQIDGIRFHSSKVQISNSDCFVLFCDQEQSRSFLKLVDHDHLGI